MIIDFLLNWVKDAFHTIMSGIPHVDVPSWITGAASAVSTLFSYVGSLGVWFPGALALTIITALLGVWLVGFGIKIVRIIISLFTLGGGSAA